MIRIKLPTFWVVPFLAAVLLSGCQTPVGVIRVDSEVVNYQLTKNVLSEGVPSPSTDIVLHISDLTEAYRYDPRGSLKKLHDRLLISDRPDLIAFALAELSYLYAKKEIQPSYYLAAAMYAYLYLFPENPEHQPNPLDPRIRVAADL